MKHIQNASQEAALRLLRQAEREVDPQREDALILLARAQWHLKNETAPASVTLPRPLVLTSSSSNHAQYNAGEVVFTCPSCGSADLTSLWGGNYLDTLTACRTCGAKHAEDPDVTIHFPEFCPDYAAYAPYTEPAAAPAEVAA